MELRGWMGRRPLSPVQTPASANSVFWISSKEVNFSDHFDIGLWRRKNVSLWLIFIFIRLLLRSVSRLDHTVSDVRIMVNTKLGCEWKREWPELLTSIFTESLRNTTKSLFQESRRPGRPSATCVLPCIYFGTDCPSERRHCVRSWGAVLEPLSLGSWKYVWCNILHEDNFVWIFL